MGHRRSLSVLARATLILAATLLMIALLEGHSSDSLSQQPTAEAKNTSKQGTLSTFTFKLRAISHTAVSITGDIEISTDEAIVLGGKRYPSKLVRELQVDEIREAARLFSVEPPRNSSALHALYKTDIPATQKLLRGNTLCGDEDTTWIVSLTDDENPQVWNLAFFSGAREPDLDSLPGLCGTYRYQLFIPNTESARELDSFRPNAAAKSLTAAPGAIVCDNLATVRLVFDLYAAHWEDRVQDALTKGQATQLRGQSSPVPNPSAYGCSLLTPGTPVQVLNSDAFTTGIPRVVAKLPNGKPIRGVTLPSMLAKP